MMTGAACSVNLPAIADPEIAPPVPLSRFVTAPPLAVVKITLFVKDPTTTGANRTTMLVLPKPATEKVAPDTIANGPVTLTAPLLAGVPPELVTAIVVCAVAPVVTVPNE